MTRVTRREALKLTTAGLFAAPALAAFGTGRVRAAGPNSEIRLGVIGLGGTGVPGAVGGRGRQLIEAFRQIPGVRIAALCDVDQAVLANSVDELRLGKITAYRDLRKVLDDKTIDVVAIATPNHWHCLATVWACQAGKDVYVEKPFSYSIWEGQQALAAARRANCIVQVGTQSRSCPPLRDAVEYLKSGAIGPIRIARVVVYRQRQGIGTVSGPTPIPKTVNYDLWCGPAPVEPLMRKHLHYEWHWFWNAGNGEIGNNGAHEVDVGRWALGQDEPPPRAICIGGRFGFHNCGETPNTQIVLFDYRPAPMLVEIRNHWRTKQTEKIDMVVDCEGGSFVQKAVGKGGVVLDKQGKTIKEFLVPQPDNIGFVHVRNFVDAVRSRKRDSLHAEAAVGHASAACCHMANISYRIGTETAPEQIHDAIRSESKLSDTFEKCRVYLRENGVDISKTKAVLGPWVTLDWQQQRFTGAMADRANQLLRRSSYRQPFAFPTIES